MQKFIELAGEQTIYQARETHSLLAALLLEASSIQVELAGLSEADSSFLQNLLWLQSEGKRLSIDIMLLNAPVFLQNIVTQLGLQDSIQFGGEK
jgi:ABC-type transporter Mla MlaB component